MNEWAVRVSRDGGAVRVYRHGRLCEEIAPGDDTYKAGRETAIRFAHELALEFRRFRRPNMQGMVTRGICETWTLVRALRLLLAAAEEGGMRIAKSDAIVTEVSAAVLHLDDSDGDAETVCGVALDNLRDFLYDDDDDDDDDDEGDDDDDDDDEGDEYELNPTRGESRPAPTK